MVIPGKIEEEDPSTEDNNKRIKLNNGKSSRVADSLINKNDGANSSSENSNTSNNGYGGSGNDETNLGSGRDTNPFLYDSEDDESYISIIGNEHERNPFLCDSDDDSDTDTVVSREKGTGGGGATDVGNTDNTPSSTSSTHGIEGREAVGNTGGGALNGGDVLGDGDKEEGGDVDEERDDTNTTTAEGGNVTPISNSTNKGGVLGMEEDDEVTSNCTDLWRNLNRPLPETTTTDDEEDLSTRISKYLSPEYQSEKQIEEQVLEKVHSVTTTNKNNTITPGSSKIPKKRNEKKTHQMFEVVVPGGVAPGQTFSLVADGQRVTLICPQNAKPGGKVRFQLPIPEEGSVAAASPKKKAQDTFEVVVPEGVKAGDAFSLLADGQKVTLLCPEGKGGGDSVRFQLPMSSAVSFETKKCKTAWAGSSDVKRMGRQKKKVGTKRGNYKLNKLQQEAEDVYSGINELNAPEKCQSIIKIFSTPKDESKEAMPNTIGARLEVFKKRHQNDSSYHLLKEA